MDAAQQDGEREPVRVQHAARHPIVAHAVQVRRDDEQPGRVVRFALELRVVVQHRAEDVEEHLQRVLVEEVHLVQAVHREVDVRAGLRQGQVLLRHRLDLADHLIRLLHLLPDVGRLLLERFQRGDDGIVVQNLTLRVVQRLQPREPLKGSY